MPADELLDPVGYSWWVTALAVGIVVVVIVWILWVLVSRRLVRGLRGPAVGPPPPPTFAGSAFDRLAAMRAFSLQRVAAVERRHAAGELDARGLHLALSAVVRDFATARGIDARHMSLREIQAVSGTARLARLIESYYRPAFSRATARAADPRAAIAGAREVIRSW